MLGGVQAQSMWVDVTVESLSSVLPPTYIWSQLWEDGSSRSAPRGNRERGKEKTGKT